MLYLLYLHNIIRHHGCDNYVAIPHSAAEKNPTSKIQQSRRYLSEWDAEGVVPYNSELWQILSTGERCSLVEVISPRQQQGSAEKNLPYNSEFTANPEHGRTLFAPTDYSGEFVMPQNRYSRCLVHNSVQLCSFLTPHSSLLT